MFMTRSRWTGGNVLVRTHLVRRVWWIGFYLWKEVYDLGFRESIELGGDKMQEATRIDEARDFAKNQLRIRPGQ